MQVRLLTPKLLLLLDSAGDAALRGSDGGQKAVILALIVRINKLKEVAEFSLGPRLFADLRQLALAVDNSRKQSAQLLCRDSLGRIVGVGDLRLVRRGRAAHDREHSPVLQQVHRNGG